MKSGPQATDETATERIFRAIRQAILTIAIAGVSAAIVGIVAAEVIGAALTRALPGGPTHIAALVVGVLLGYAAAATATIWALVTGVAEAIGAVAGDVERAGERVVYELETLAGVRERQREAITPPVVAGSVATPDQPSMMSNTLVDVPSTGRAAVAPRDKPLDSSAHLGVPLVPTTN
jgi:hypothetical protein